jgi:hydrogenase-4 membrane subunit HyfE
MEYLIRFLAGGIVVSAFAVLGDVLRPKSIAGWFGAAPSVALATLSLALWKEGGDYVLVEGRLMILGSLALALYSLVVCQLLMRARWSPLAATTTTKFLWLTMALGSKHLFIG